MNPIAYENISRAFDMARDLGFSSVESHYLYE
jgi:hypothetical protein